TPDPTPEELKQQFAEFREAFAAEKSLEAFSQKLAEAMEPLEQQGLLKALPDEHDANREKIFVRKKDATTVGRQVNVSDVLSKQAAAKLQTTLNEKLPSLKVSERVFAYLEPRLMTMTTL